MKQKLLTDQELRAGWSRNPDAPLYLEEGTILTPSARDFITEHHIDVRTGAATMTRTPIPHTGGEATYVELATGRELHEKPETLTHLRGNQLVPKTHPQIAFRGKLDSLMADFLCAECEAEAAHQDGVLADLEDLLACVRAILGAEVKNEPLDDLPMLGMDHASLRRASHHIREELGIDHPIPDRRMGRLCLLLNRLRTQARETELAAAQAFAQPGGGTARPDLIRALNRLSSAIYLIFCRQLAGWYEGRHRK